MLTSSPSRHTLLQCCNNTHTTLLLYFPFFPLGQGAVQCLKHALVPTRKLVIGVLMDSVLAGWRVCLSAAGGKHLR